MKAFKMSRLQVCKVRLQRLIAIIKSRLQVCKPLYKPLQLQTTILP
jgi:hypothetical protein